MLRLNVGERKSAGAANPITTAKKIEKKENRPLFSHSNVKTRKEETYVSIVEEKFNIDAQQASQCFNLWPPKTLVRLGEANQVLHFAFTFLCIKMLLVENFS